MPPNVLLIVLDSVRAQNTSLHGYHRDTTPFISDFAEENIVFHEARTPSVASLPSHISVFTGYHTEEHDFGNDEHRNFTLKNGVTIWEKIAKKYGYETGVFSNNPYLTSLSVGIKSSFDTVNSSKQAPFTKAIDPRDYHGEGNIDYIKFIRDSISSGMPVRSVINGFSLYSSGSKWHDMILPRIFQPTAHTSSFLNWIDDTSGKPWAACINLMDAHTPYVPSSECDKWGTKEQREFQNRIEHFRWEFTGSRYSIDQLQKLENLYDGCILEADKKVEKIIHGLQRREVLDDTLVVITSDHGEGFGEPSRIRPKQHAVGHTVGIHESQLHVPLVVHIPNETGKESKTIDKLATLTNFPTVVQNVIERTQSPEDGFVPEENLLATQLPLGEKDLELAESYGTEVDTVSGKLRAVYKEESDRILKHMSWGQLMKTIEINENGIREVPKANTGKEIQNTFDSIGNRQIKNENLTKTGEKVEERLSDLGYV